MSTVGDILSTVGVFSIVGDIMSTVGVILSTVGMFSTVGRYHDARGGYHEYRGGCSVPWGEKSFVISVPHGTEHPHGTHDIPPRYSNFKG